MTRNALGRGLGALIREPEALVGTNAEGTQPTTAPTKSPDDSAGAQGTAGASPAEQGSSEVQSFGEGVAVGRDAAERTGQGLAEHEPSEFLRRHVSVEQGSMSQVSAGAGGGPATGVAARKVPTTELERPLARPLPASAPRPYGDAGGAGQVGEVGRGGNYSGVLFIDVELIRPSRFQPRKTFSEESLDQLARSITNSGVIQPIAVRKIENHYELIAGERRWRAAQRAELRKIPAIVHDVADEVALEFMLIENLQREDLNAMEEARAYERLIQEFGLTHDEVAARTGKDRTTIANSLRLMGLEKSLQQMMEEGTLSASAGRALLAVSDSGFRRRMASRYARGALTVRQIEKLAARQARRERGAHETKPPIAAAAPDPNIQGALEELQRSWGTKVLLVAPVGKKPGQLIFEYYDQRQLMGLWDRLASKQ